MSTADPGVERLDYSQAASPQSAAGPASSIERILTASLRIDCIGGGAIEGQ
jgi:hypothetical protein